MAAISGLKYSKVLYKGFWKILGDRSLFLLHNTAAIRTLSMVLLVFVASYQFMLSASTNGTASYFLFATFFIHGYGVIVEPPFKSFRRMAGSAIVIPHSVPSHKDKKVISSPL
jgi:hypothetical protein